MPLPTPKTYKVFSLIFIMRPSASLTGCYGSFAMNMRTVNILLTMLLMSGSGIALSQKNDSEVTHWEDGSSMECSFIFEQEPLLEWNQIDPPPITIETAAVTARIWGERKNLTNVAATVFKLIGVHPWGHDYPMLVMFVKYFGFPSQTPIISGDDYHWLAITPTGIVVEPTCDDP